MLIIRQLDRKQIGPVRDRIDRRELDDWQLFVASAVDGRAGHAALSSSVACFLWRPAVVCRVVWRRLQIEFCIQK